MGLSLSGLLVKLAGNTGAWILIVAVTIGCLVMLGALSIEKLASVTLKKSGTVSVMVTKWLEKVRVNAAEYSKTRTPWITKETIFVYDETKPVNNEPVINADLPLFNLPAHLVSPEPISNDYFSQAYVEESFYDAEARNQLHNVDDYSDDDFNEPCETLDCKESDTLTPNSFKKFKTPEGVAVNRITGIAIDPIFNTEVNDIPVRHYEPEISRIIVETKPSAIEINTEYIEPIDAALEDAATEGSVNEFSEDELKAPETPQKVKPLDGLLPADQEVAAKVFENIQINEEYIIPMNFLHTSPKQDRESWETEIRRNSELLVKTLRDFGIESRVSMVNRGPVVTLYEMQLAPGVKVTRVVSLSDDIALALAASRVRVVAPIPGKAAIGIEVPNGRREMVTLGDILGTQEFRASEMMLKIAMGKDILGKPVMIDLKRQPHLLIAGATGAGKSVCVNAVIASLIYNYNPNHLRFIMIDPKMVELTLYNGLPHLLTPVITDPDEAPKALKWAIFEMERRYKLLSGMCTRDIDRYNQKVSSAKHPEELEHLPYIVVIIDEFADLMMVAPKEMENYVTRIAQKARAVGIHVVLATQRPSVDIITGIIKANFPARVAFQVAQKTDSRTIIDQNGAEKLLGKGDLLYQSPTSSFPVRLQGAYISEEEVMQIVQQACKYARPRYIDFDEFLKEQNASDNEPSDAERDEIFVEALRIVEETKKASASYLQRRLSIGYNRAARIIERMEELGYVGPQQGSKPREVYV